MKSRLKKLITKTADNENINAYQILFDQFGDEIASLDLNEAINFCLNKIQEINTQYEGNENYVSITEQDIYKLKQEFLNADNGMDVLFIIKDFLLQDEK